jgi:carbon storage regulator CsrA
MALTLTLKDDEKIYVGDNIIISVYRHKSAIRISIEAPREIRILRDKIKREIDDINRDAGEAEYNPS